MTIATFTHFLIWHIKHKQNFYEGSSSINHSHSLCKEAVVSVHPGFIQLGGLTSN